MTPPRLNDAQLVDLFDQIIDAYQMEDKMNPSEQFHVPVGEFFAEICQRPDNESAGWGALLCGTNKVSFHPRLIPSWQLYSDQTRSCILNTTCNASLTEVARFRLDTIRIARKFGETAAILFKMSDGAMDPRKEGDQ